MSEICYILPAASHIFYFIHSHTNCEVSHRFYTAGKEAERITGPQELRSREATRQSHRYRESVAICRPHLEVGDT